MRTSNCSPFVSATWRNVRSTKRCSSSRRTSPTSTATVPDSIFERSRMSLMSMSRSLPDEWIVRANSTCLPVRFPSLLPESWSERMSRLLSGVRSSWDMFARNSDLYFEVRASCRALSSSAWRASSTSRFLCSTSWFWCARRRAFSCSSSLVVCNSCPRLCSSCASVCDCVSRSSVRVLASIVLITMPMDSVSWSRNAWWISLNPSKDASSSTPFTSFSNTIGSTRIARGAALPRPDAMRRKSEGGFVIRILRFSSAHCPTRPSPRPMRRPCADSPPEA